MSAPEFTAAERDALGVLLKRHGLDAVLAVASEVSQVATPAWNVSTSRNRALALSAAQLRRTISLIEASDVGDDMLDDVAAVMKEAVQ